MADRIAIVGLGYVGLPLAVEFGKKIETIGFDINSSRVEELKQGKDTTLEVKKEELIEAKKIDAKECLHFSIANKVSSVENLQKDTMDWALKLAKRSPQALANTKKLMRESLSNSYLDTYNNEAEIQNELVRSPQNIEAVTAFFEKREPNFD